MTLPLSRCPHHITMSGCTLQFTRSSPLRTTLVDEATGQAKYQIDTPIRIAGSVTRIRKFDSDTQHPYDSDNDANSDSDDDIIHWDKKGGSDYKSDSKKHGNDDEEEDLEAVDELPETSDEIARIYWRWFSTDKIVFQGKISSRDVFLPKCGKMKG